jgi:hypothetical protein
MNHIQKTKKTQLELRERQALEILKDYEILENMKRNDDEGKIPKMLSFEKAELIQFLEENKEINERVKLELIEIRKQLLCL